MQEQISSISHFLQQGGFHFRFYDMGRRVTKISNQLFEKIENQHELYPYPFQQSAWIAVLFWDKQGHRDNSVIWFLRFPIDELGYLQLSSRDAFIQQILDQVGMDAQAKLQGKPVSSTSEESPFAFKPKQDRLAIFHAKAAKELGQAASKYYQHTQDYLKGDIGYEQWEFLGLQGIADVVARLDEGDNNKSLTKAIKKIPDTPLEVICNMLEHGEPSRTLTEALVKKLDIILQKEKSATLVASLVRALSNSAVKPLRISAWHRVLNSTLASEIEILAALSGRAWSDLKNKDLFKLFLTTLSHCNQEQFNILLFDLMAIPSMREPILKVMRLPERTKILEEKIGTFFQVSRKAQG